MQLDVRSAAVSDLAATLEQLTGDLTALLAPLSPAQLNWKPNPEEWSLGQCLDHIMVANGSYFPTLEGLLSGRRSPSFVERLPVLPGLFGPMLINSLHPSANAKVPTIKAFAPTSSDVRSDIVAAFTRQQAELAELMRACARLDAARVIITSPAAGFITYSLLDAFRIIVVHEQHHLAQTTRITRLPGFPQV
jgi:uncharacterized damage-inducible protein DinB